jgi:hypothetical protein
MLKQNPKTSHIRVVGVTAWEAGTVASENFESRYCDLLDKDALTTVSHPKRDAILTLAFCFALFLGFAFATHGQAEKHYIYQGRDGELVVSNKEPPPGSIVIEQQSLPDGEFPQALESAKPEPNGQAEGSPEPSETEIK